MPSSLGQVYGDDTLVVEYNDACIYGRDLALLETETAWLNDSCINYYFTRLQEKAQLGDILMDPAVVAFFMHQCEEEEEMLDFASGYKRFASVHRIFLPINDSMANAHWQTPGLGTHWSLLLVLVTSQGCSYIHLDSSRGSNRQAALAVATKWSGFWNHVVAGSTSPRGGKVKLNEATVVQQTNGYDCGVHVLAATEVLVSSCPPDSTQEIQQRALDAHLNDNRKNRHLIRDLRFRVAQDIREIAAQSKS